MGTKTITITNEAYERLAVNKGANESFSDVINKITRKHSIFDLFGILSKECADELEKHILENRKRMRVEMERRISNLK